MFVFSYQIDDLDDEVAMRTSPYSLTTSGQCAAPSINSVTKSDGDTSVTLTTITTSNERIVTTTTTTTVSEVLHCINKFFLELHEFQFYR